jgi:flagellar biosynthesis/type III secretory pathway chaperone
MMPTLQRLIESLRKELQQYGEMLALLDQQQEDVTQRRTSNVWSSVASIDAQGAVIANARVEREAAHRALSRALGQPDATTIAELLPLLPSDYRPLISALVDENNELLARVQSRARQNHLLLRRSVELMQQFIGSLCVVSQPVYNCTGGIGQGAFGSSIYEAVG